MKRVTEILMTINPLSVATDLRGTHDTSLSALPPYTVLNPHISHTFLTHSAL